MSKLLLLFPLVLLFSCSRPVSFPHLKEITSSSFGEVYDRDGELIHEKRIDLKINRRSWVALNELPEQMVGELVLLEDKRFYSHFGVDPMALLQVVKEWPNRGASTITMQLIKLMENKGQVRSLFGKLNQIVKALQLEFTYSKDEIIEAYLNLLPLAGEVQGLHAGARSFFGKHPRGLSLEERVLIYSMIPSPNQTPERLRQRACRYFKKLKGQVPCENLYSVLENSFIRAPKTEISQDLAPHMGRKVLKGKNLFRTTLDKKLQSEVIKTLKGHIRDLHDQNVRDGAVLIIGRKSADVLAYVGSSGEHSSSPHVDHVEALRQAGSTLKPLLFAGAIEKRLITSTTLLRDEPYSITKDGLTYQPDNYQKSFTMKDVPAKVALGSSLNVPAIRVIDLFTPERFYSMLVSLGFRELREEEHYGHSMALGAVDVTLWDLVRSYRALAEGGEIKELNLEWGKTGSARKTKYITPEVGHIISSILSEKENRHLSFGLQSSLSTDSWAAVKTGTSKDMRDNWCVGFTDAFVIGVWIGNSSGEPMWNVSGVTGAAPIFNHLVSYLHQKRPSRSPSLPPEIVKVGEDLYLKGTEPKKKGPLLVNESNVGRIVYPQNGTQFAYDPEIPVANQRVLFRKSGTKGIFKLNGQELTREEIQKGFLPDKKGTFRLELWEEKVLLDSVSFIVRAGKTI